MINFLTLFIRIFVSKMYMQGVPFGETNIYITNYHLNQISSREKKNQKKQ